MDCAHTCCPEGAFFSNLIIFKWGWWTGRNGRDMPAAVGGGSTEDTEGSEGKSFFHRTDSQVHLERML